jgi:flavin-dependent dehydrogenase
MTGDAAGMITPLCGNGMAMAMHSSKIACDLIRRSYAEKNFTSTQLENLYTKMWNKTFAFRLWNGRQIQRLFGSKVASNLAINLAIYSRPVANTIIRNTHGDAF